MGELDNFPPVAQNSIGESGGLQTFLLQSDRFIRMGSCMALAKQAVTLQQVEGAASLDQLDGFEYQNMKPTFPNPHASAFTSDRHVIVSATGDVYPTLPVTSNYYYYPPAPFPHAACPFAGSAFTESGPSFEWANVDPQQLSSYYSPNDVEEVDLYSAGAVVDVVEDDPSSSSVAAEENVLWKHAAVQVGAQFHPEKRRAVRDLKILSFVCFSGFSGDEERCSEYRASRAFREAPGGFDEPNGFEQIWKSLSKFYPVFGIFNSSRVTSTKCKRASGQWRSRLKKCRVTVKTTT